MPAPNRPSPDPGLPAVRRPDIPGGTVCGLPRRGRHPNVCAAQMPCLAGTRLCPLGGLGPRLAAQQSPWISAVLRPAHRETTTRTTIVAPRCWGNNNNNSSNNNQMPRRPIGWMPPQTGTRPSAERHSFNQVPPPTRCRSRPDNSLRLDAIPHPDAAPSVSCSTLAWVPLVN